MTSPRRHRLISAGPLAALAILLAVVTIAPAPSLASNPGKLLEVATIRSKFHLLSGVEISLGGTTVGTDPTISFGTAAPTAAEPNGSWYFRTLSTGPAIYRRVGTAWVATAGAAVADLVMVAGTRLEVSGGGAIAATQGMHTVDGAGGASDTLASITGGTADEVIFLRPDDAAADITLQHGIGADLIQNPGGLDIILGDLRDWAMLAYDGTQWTTVAHNALLGSSIQIPDSGFATFGAGDDIIATADGTDLVWTATGTADIVLGDDVDYQIGTTKDFSLSFTSATPSLDLYGLDVTAGGATAGTSAIRIDTGARTKNDNNAGTPTSGAIAIVTGETAMTTAAATGGLSGALSLYTGASDVTFAGATGGATGAWLGGSGASDSNDGAATAGDTGPVTLQSGDAAATAGTSGASGALNLESGTSVSSTSGAISITSGIVSAGAGNSGDVSLSTGTSAGGTRGSLNLGGGAAVDFDGAGAVTGSGNPTWDFGTSQADFGGNLDANAGLDVSVAALTSSAGTTNSGGELLVSGGNVQVNDDIVTSFGSGDDYTATWINASTEMRFLGLDATDAASGSLRVDTGDGTSTAGAASSGAIVIASGASNTNGNAANASGAVSLVSGTTDAATAHAASASGAITVASGNTAASAAGTGATSGAVVLQSGDASAAVGTGGGSGTVTLESGSSANLASGLVTIQSGLVSAGAGNSGDVAITTGTSAGGTRGALTLGGGAAIDFDGAGAVTATGNPTWDFGTSQADFGGNLDANAGLDVSGAALVVATAQNLQTDRLAETTGNAGIRLTAGEILGVPNTLSATVNYDDGDGAVFSVPAGEVWLVERVWFRTTTDWDGDGTLTFGDGNDTDGFLILANAALDTAVSEFTNIGIAGTYGLLLSNGAAYQDDGALDLRHQIYTGAETIDVDVTAGTSSQGIGTVYLTYIRIS